MSVPFFEMIWKWVSEGVLSDPFEELMITCNKEDCDLWSSKYFLDHKMRPPFISSSLATKVFFFFFFFS